MLQENDIYLSTMIASGKFNNNSKNLTKRIGERELGFKPSYSSFGQQADKWFVNTTLILFSCIVFKSFSICNKQNLSLDCCLIKCQKLTFIEVKFLLASLSEKETFLLPLVKVGTRRNFISLGSWRSICERMFGILDQKIRFYNTTTGSKYKCFKTVEARDVGWSVLDVAVR